MMEFSKISRVLETDKFYTLLSYKIKTASTLFSEFLLYIYIYSIKVPFYWRNGYIVHVLKEIVGKRAIKQLSFKCNDKNNENNQKVCKFKM